MIYYQINNNLNSNNQLFINWIKEIQYSIFESQITNYLKFGIDN
jgi:hypothetical protein